MIVIPTNYAYLEVRRQMYNYPKEQREERLGANIDLLHKPSILQSTVSGTHNLG
jgi:hypothetical protein